MRAGDEFLYFIVIKVTWWNRVITHEKCFMSLDWRVRVAVCLRCAQLQYTVKHQGSQQDTNNIKDCLKGLNECGESIPICVALLGWNCSSCYLLDLAAWTPPIYSAVCSGGWVWSMHEALEAVVAMARRITAVKELHTLPGKIQRAEGVSWGGRCTGAYSTTSSARGTGLACPTFVPCEELGCEERKE